jgi:L-iditol 2-dehydrogenase
MNMKAIILKSTRNSVFVTDKPMPKIIDPDEILVRIQACGICATDLKMYKGEYSGYLPVTPGHEFTGEVVAVGEKVTKYVLGNRVTVDPNESCCACTHCRNAHSTYCENMAAYGVFKDGGLAEYAKAHEKGLYRVPDNLPPKIAAFIEPISCAIHGIDRADIKLGDSVVIIGAGTMGQLLLQMARNTGAAHIIHIDKIAWKLEVSKNYGASEVINNSVEDPIAKVMEITGGKGADVVIEAVGHPSVLELAMQLVARGGRIVQFGFAAEGAKAQLEPFAILQKEITIVGSWINPYTYERAMQMLSSGKISVNHLITHELTLEEYEKGIHLIETQPKGFMKAIVLM